MHIITSEGKIMEGQELTAEEVSIFKELTTDGGKINDAADVYIADRTAQRIAKYLIENFRITRRSQPAETAIEAIEREMPALAQPEVDPQADRWECSEAAPEAAKSDDIPF